MTGPCWTCDFQKIGGHLTFLGLCRWFVLKRAEPEKPIPPDRVDVGCKFWTIRTRPTKGDEHGESDQGS